MPSIADLPPQPTSWWEEVAPCPPGSTLQHTASSTFCRALGGPIGPVTRRDGLGRVVEEGRYASDRSPHGRWVRWSWGTGPDPVSWTISLYDQGANLVWAHDSDHPLMGNPLPALALQASDGATVAVPAEGTTIVELWTTGCGPCLRAMPHLAELSSTFSVPVLAVSADADPAAWRAFLRRGEPPVPTAWGGLPLLQALQTHSLGTTFVVHDGQVVGTVLAWAGPHDVRLETLLTAIARDVPPASLVAGTGP